MKSGQTLKSAPKTSQRLQNGDCEGVIPSSLLMETRWSAVGCEEEFVMKTFSSNPQTNTDNPNKQLR